MSSDHPEAVMIDRRIAQLEDQIRDIANELLNLQGCDAFVLPSRDGADMVLAVGTPDDIGRLLDSRRTLI
jgi:hypothetical protein